MNQTLPRVFAYYLPQYYPIPENDKWWGKGFTEWTNVGKARPLFPGHYQPKVPADLGYYDLRVPETRIAQAELAKEYGIEGFVYWHYWFGNGRRLLERPFDEVLSSGKPDFPFALAWANESWRGFYHGLNNEREVLIEQTYLGKDDYVEHFNCVVQAFKDKRYITIDGKPIFIIYHPLDFPDVSSFVKSWQEMAKLNGLKGIYFIGMSFDRNQNSEILSLGFDAVNTNLFNEYTKYRRPLLHSFKAKILKWLFGCPHVVFYDDVYKHFISKEETKENVFPTVFPNWDHSPRTGKNGIIVVGSHPDEFTKSFQQAMSSVKDKPQEKAIIFVKSWNEWAEGNYLEPDMKFGQSYLKVIKDAVADK